MRSILVTVDETPSALAAQRLALGLARRTGASVRGIVGIDVSDLEGVELAPIGAMKYALDRLHRREQKAQQRRARIAEFPVSFERACAAAGVQGHCRTLESDIRVGLLRAIETCDIVVTGQDTEFHLEPLDGTSPLVEYIVAKGSRPVLVTGPEAAESGPVLVGYDGSAPAAKALQLAVQLGMFGSSVAHVLSVSSERDEAFETASRARDFLAMHGVSAEIEAEGSTGHPADVLCERAAQIRARMLVMGAFGHRGLHEMLFGSSTRRLLEAPAVPLFIYH
jgi:nucleotide-binding universal stress UspA family protein